MRLYSETHDTEREPAWEPPELRVQFTDEMQVAWQRLTERLRALFDREVKMEAIILLIGMREMGFAPRKFSKQEKTDLLHVGMCTVLARAGYYVFEKFDEEGWPHWKLLRPVEHLDFITQINFLRYHVLHYFLEVYDDLMPRSDERTATPGQEVR